MKPHVQAIFDDLVSNGPSFTDLNIELVHFNDDDDLELVFNATKRNHTLKSLMISAGRDVYAVVVLSVGAALLLACLITRLAMMGLVLLPIR
jgi:hypothetical protein